MRIVENVINANYNNNQNIHKNFLSHSKTYLMTLLLCYFQWRNQPENIGRKFFFLPNEKYWYDFFFLPTKNKLVGNFLLLLKSNGIKTFLINDNNVIIKKLKYDLKMFKK